MTQTIATNENNDIYLKNGFVAINRDLQAVLSACETATKAQYGEMILSNKNGLPNFETIWSGTRNVAIWQSYLRKTLQKVEGVLEVKDLQIALKNNILSYTATIRTKYGNSILNG